MEKHPSGISTSKCLTCVDDLWRSQLEPVSHLGCDERNLKPGHQHCVDTAGGCWRLLDSHLFQSWRSLGPLEDIMTGLRLEM